jgi:hypothetical protein
MRSASTIALLVLKMSPFGPISFEYEPVCGIACRSPQYGPEPLVHNDIPTLLYCGTRSTWMPHSPNFARKAISCGMKVWHGYRHSFINTSICWAAMNAPRNEKRPEFLPLRDEQLVNVPNDQIKNAVPVGTFAGPQDFVLRFHDDKLVATNSGGQGSDRTKKTSKYVTRDNTIYGQKQTSRFRRPKVWEESVTPTEAAVGCPWPLFMGGVANGKDAELGISKKIVPWCRSRLVEALYQPRHAHRHRRTAHTSSPAYR